MTDPKKVDDTDAELDRLLALSDEEFETWISETEAIAYPRMKALSALREVEGRNEALSRSLDQAREAAAKLNASELYLDDNHPWRIMVTRGRQHFAIAEQHHETILGDGEWKDGKVICDVVNAVLSSLEGNQKQTKTGRLPPAEGRAGGADAPQPASQSSPFGRSSLTHLAELSAKATFGPWEVHTVEWTAYTGHVVTESRIQSVGIQPQLKDRVPIISLSTRATKDGPQTGLWVLHEDAALIVAAVNYVREVLASCDGNAKRQDPKGETA